MNRVQHLLIKIVEEATEVAQQATKALRFGLNKIEPGQRGPIPLTNDMRLCDKIADLRVAVNMLHDEGYLKLATTENDLNYKRKKVERFLKYSKECGTLE